MDRYISVENTMLQFKLEQLGATVKKVKGIMCFVEYSIDEKIKLRYLYHINAENKYILQRRLPYDTLIDIFDDEEDIVRVIEKDIDKFKNAKRSKKFDEFIRITKEFTDMVSKFENLYLIHNVSKYDLADIKEKMKNLQDKIQEVEDKNLIAYKEDDGQRTF